MFSRYQLADFDLLLAEEDIRQHTEWRVGDDRHHFIVHLGGQMNQLETEIEGHAGCVGPAVPGEVWSVPAEHKYESCAVGGVIRYAVLSLQKTRPNAHSAAPSMYFDILAGIRDDKLHAAVERLSQAVKSPDDTSKMDVATLSGGISRHLEGKYSRTSASDASEPAPALTRPQVRSLRSYMYDNLAGHITIEMLARLVDLTTHHLLIAFKRAFWTTPAQYLIAQRIRNAQWLLLHTSLEVTHIALESGFSSHSHLSSSFRN